MKIGIFDSGLGGLFILRKLKQDLPKYDYVFLGDTKNLPYGNKSQTEIYKLGVKAVEDLFKQDCALVIVACNTVSAQALRKIQRVWLPKSKYKDRKVLGVIRPTAEAASELSGKVGLIGTLRTIKSSSYSRELKNINPRVQLISVATPLLVPMIEAGNLDKVDEILKHYLKPLQKQKINALILGCTHYCVLNSKAEKILGPRVKVISQDKLLPRKLKSYLTKHSEIERKLSKNGKLTLLVTKASPLYSRMLKDWFGEEYKLKVVKY
jgi:glutamate racemase